MITITLGWWSAAALLAWSLLAFWLGRTSAGPHSGDLSGPPPTLSRPRATVPAGLSPEALSAIRHELAGGNKINAIKVMREATGLGLAEAKQAVEALAP